MTIEEFVNLLPKHRRTSTGYVGLCPAHDDNKFSLSINLGDNGCIMIKCHAGCFWEDVVEAMSLTARDLAPPSVNGQHPPRETVYQYRDERGEILFESVRTADKRFWQRLPGKSGGGLGDVRRVLYGLPDLLAAGPGLPVVIVEGEKDVETLRRAGHLATTSPMGAGKWRQEYTDWLHEHLAEHPFLILPDNDPPGINHAEEVYHSLRNAGLAAATVLLPDLPPHGDVTDWLQMGNSLDELSERLNSLNSSGDNSLNSSGEKSLIRSFVGPPLSSPCLEIALNPKLADEAYYGIVGELTRAILPHSEADAGAILISLLVAFGSWLGRSPHTTVEDSRHGLNLFACIVGESGNARKGTSWNRARRILYQLDPKFARDQVQTGLSSGEGLVWAIRDPIIKRTQLRDPKSKRLTMDFDEEVVDTGVTDKRLLLIQQEMGSSLKVMNRPGNLLSGLMREAWDGGNLQLMTKHNACCASDTHVSILGHITPSDLTAELSENETANGFGNRFLWVFSSRSQFLPEGGSLEGLASVGSILSNHLERLEESKGIGLITRDEEARAVWGITGEEGTLYWHLTQGSGGLYGEITGRAEAQTLRLSALYAALDGSRKIRIPHLLAAVAVWDYCDQTALQVFGHAVGDELADDLWMRLQFAESAGLTMTEIHELTGRNRLAASLRAKLLLLERVGKARVVSEAAALGRRTERWFALPGEKPRPGGFLEIALKRVQALRENV